MIASTGTTSVPQEESIGFRILRSIRGIIRRTSEHSRSLSRHGGITVPQLERIVDLMDAEGIDAAPVLTLEVEMGPNGTTPAVDPALPNAPNIPPTAEPTNQTGS